MRKTTANIICWLVPKKEWRQKVRKYFGGIKHFVLFNYDSGWNFVNLGDYVQTIATRNAINKRWPDAIFSECPRDHIGISKKKGVVIMQGFFPANPSSMIPSASLTPTFIGFHLGGDGDEMCFTYGNEQTNSENTMEIFICQFPSFFKSQSIGCRDIRTMNFFSRHGVDSYFSRCLSFTLPLRTNKPDKKCVVLSDVHKELLDFIPQELKQNSIKQNPKILKIPYMEYSIFSNDGYMKLTEESLNFLKEEATLVITNRIHVAAPAIAMGIPVILYRRSKTDCRYEMFNGIIPVYSMDDFKNGKVDFDPQAPSIEDLKKLLIRNLYLSVTGKHKEELRKIRKMIAEYTVKEGSKVGF